MKLRLRLEERHDDRVFVTVSLSPESDGVVISGVAVELRTRFGEPLSNRLMLPISGPLPGPLALRTEVRAREDLPRSAVVHGVVWFGPHEATATCPADPGTTLHAHALGSPIALPDGALGPVFFDLTDRERACMESAFPWMATFVRAGVHEEEGILEEASQDLAEDIAQCYGLCDEDKAFLEELLGSDDDLAEEGDAWDDLTDWDQGTPRTGNG